VLEVMCSAMIKENLQHVEGGERDIPKKLFEVEGSPTNTNPPLLRPSARPQHNGKKEGFKKGSCERKERIVGEKNRGHKSPPGKNEASVKGFGKNQKGILLETSCTPTGRRMNP